MLRIAALLIFVITTLTGCSLHSPTPIARASGLPDSYLEQSTTAALNAAPERWWLAFGDERLNLLMEELFAENLNLEQAFARLEQARSVLSGTGSSRYPKLSLNAQKGRSQQPQMNGDFTGGNWQVAAGASFEIDLWGQLAARTDAARKDYAASVEDLKTLYLSLSGQLADLYYQAVNQRAQLALASQTVASAQDTLALVENRYRKGLVTSIDIYQARQTLTSVQAKRHTSEANLAVLEHAIAVLLGRYPDRDSAGELAVLPPVPQSFPAGLPASLLADRPDLKAALNRVEAADSRVAAAIADRFPSINLIGNYGRTSQDTSAGLLEGNFWSLLGQLTMPLIDAGQRKAEVTRTRAIVAETVASYRQTVLEAVRDVEDALAKNRELELQIEQLAATETATGATLRLAKKRYLSGLTDYLPVLTAQRNHFDVQSTLLSARQQLLSERIALARALGGNWMTEVMEQRTLTKADSDEQ